MANSKPRKKSKKRKSPLQKIGERKRQEYKKELAKMVYRKNGMNPPDEGDEFRYEGRANGFLTIPMELIYTGEELSHGAFRLWLILFRHNWDEDPAYRVSWPGRERLAALMGVSTRQVSDYLKELKEAGLLFSRRRLDNTNLCVLHDPKFEWMEAKIRELKEKKLAYREELLQAGCEEKFPSELEEDYPLINII